MAKPQNLTGTPGDDVLVAGVRGDVLDGRGGDDVLFGGNGRDTLIGGQGDDVLLGGNGRDTAVFRDEMGNYSFRVLPDGRIVVTGMRGAASQDGTDTLDDVELLRFADGTFDIDVVPCFAEGTRILTTRGEVPVEALVAGDEAVLWDGGTAPIVWVGRKTVQVQRHRWPDQVRPVRVCAGALEEGVPRRDLLLSPRHALALDGMLVPVGLLANGRTILAAPGFEQVTYFHVELPAHAVLTADGAPAESYLDLGHRHVFEGADGAAPTAAQPGPAFCAPLVEDGPRLAALRARLAARATAAFRLAETQESDIRVIADGQPLQAAAGTRFELPAGTRDIRILSRAACPAELEAGGDRRMLGVALSAIRLRGANGHWLDVPMDDPSLAIGFHPPERLPGMTYRWTDGAARLPGRWLAPFSDTSVTLELVVSATQRSWAMARAT